MKIKKVPRAQTMPDTSFGPLFVFVGLRWPSLAVVGLRWPLLAVVGCCGPSLTCVGLRWPLLSPGDGAGLLVKLLVSIY